jgi:hypothetical protein
MPRIREKSYKPTQLLVGIRLLWLVQTERLLTAEEGGIPIFKDGL